MKTSLRHVATPQRRFGRKGRSVVKNYLKILIAVSATSVLAGPLGIRLAMAQAQQNPSAQAIQSAQAPYAVQYDARVTVRADRTATDTFTHRIKILTPGAIATVSQQQLTFVEGMQTLETVEAFTEKSDGTKVPVGPANIMTRDAASGLQAVYMRDLKQRTVIFQDVQVGDTLVMTHRKETNQSLFPGHFLYADVFPRSRRFTSAQIIVEAPNELNLEVKTIGAGLTDKVEDSDGIGRHTVTLLPQPARAPAPRASQRRAPRPLPR